MATDHQITVIIADDHSLVRKGIISLLSCSKEIKIIGEAADGEELITLCNQLLPDVILVDVSMPVLSGLKAVALILDSGVKVKALFISMYYDEYTIDCCKAAGGVGLLSKGIVLSALIETIKRAYSDNYYFGKKCIENKEPKRVEKNDDYKEFTRDVDIEVLSPREQEVVILISQGLTSKQISDKLFLGKRTVDAYRCSILKKLRLNSFTELMKYAVRQHPDKYK